MDRSSNRDSASRGPEGTVKISSADAATVTATRVRTPSGIAPGPQTDFSGSTFGSYQLIRKIAEGGMGVVYEALQTKLSRRVALKILNERLAAEPEFLHRFEREAKAAAALNHPNIVQVHDFVEAQGRHCLILEFIEGEDLSTFVAREGKLSLLEALGIIEESAQALKYACAKSIIHRDVKPANLMFTSDRRVKVSDLGLAKILNDDSDLTMSSASLGSPHYMAPEQASDAARVDHRADIYSLGITLLYLVTGKRPYDGGTPYSVMLGHVNKPLPSGAELGTPLPEPVEKLIQNMAAKDPEARYQDYDSLLGDIRRVKAGLAPAVGHQPQPITRNRIMVAAAACFLAVLAAYLLIQKNSRKGSETARSVPAGANAALGNPSSAPMQYRRPPPSDGSLPDFAGADAPPLNGSQRPPLERFGPGAADSGGIPLPMGRPPSREFYNLPDGPVDAMLASADAYAAQHKDNFYEILDCYNQVRQKAEGTPRQTEIDDKIRKTEESLQKVVSDTINRYNEEMREKLQAGDPQAAYEVWRTFPAMLRSREVDDQIRGLLQGALPTKFSPQAISR